LNYLSHFYTHHRNDDAFNAGLILPDLARKWVRNFRTIAPGHNSFFNSLTAGCLRHYEADQVFHRSSFFGELNTSALEIIKSMDEANLVQRKWFIAHVVVEMMLDRAILKTEPAVADDFYASLDRLPLGEVGSFMQLHGCHDPVPFLRAFRHFIHAQYIRHYTDNNSLMYSLGKIMQRAGLPEHTPDALSLLLRAILTFEEKHLAGGPQLLARLKQIFE
jgi:hypothetical protein